MAKKKAKKKAGAKKKAAAKKAAQPAAKKKVASPFVRVRYTGENEQRMGRYGKLVPGMEFSMTRSDWRYVAKSGNPLFEFISDAKVAEQPHNPNLKVPEVPAEDTVNSEDETQTSKNDGQAGDNSAETPNAEEGGQVQQTDDTQSSGQSEDSSDSSDEVSGESWESDESEDSEDSSAEDVKVVGEETTHTETINDGGEVTVDDYNDLTVAVLKEEIERRNSEDAAGIDIPSGARKGDLVGLLEADDQRRSSGGDAVPEGEEDDSTESGESEGSSWWSSYDSQESYDSGDLDESSEG